VEEGESQSGAAKFGPDTVEGIVQAMQMANDLNERSANVSFVICWRADKTFILLGACCTFGIMHRAAMQGFADDQIEDIVSI
jgi:hypothetical protein